jgi:hypothetical protein
MTLQEQCLQAVRWILWGVDLFFKLAYVFQIAPLIKQHNMAEKGDHIENEETKIDREAILSNVYVWHIIMIVFADNTIVAKRTWKNRQCAHTRRSLSLPLTC